MKIFQFVFLLFIFAISCQKENSLDNQNKNFGSDGNTFSASSFGGNFEDIQLPCLQNGYLRIKPKASLRPHYEALKTEVNSSPTFNWSNDATEVFGQPIIAVSLYSQNASKQSLTIPIYKQSTQTVTAMTVVTKKNSRLSYVFYDRKILDYKHQINPTAATGILKNTFKLLDYATCGSNVLPEPYTPNNDPQGILVYNGDCYETETLEVEIPCVLKDDNILAESRSSDDCPTEIHVLLTKVDCPPGGGGGGGGGGTTGGPTTGGPGTGPGSGSGTGTTGGTNPGGSGTGGWNGSGTTGNGTTGGGGNNTVSEEQWKAAIKEAIDNLCSISATSCTNANILKQEDCDGILLKMSNYLAGNNYTPVAQCIVEKNLQETAQIAQAGASCGELNLPNITATNANINQDLLQATSQHPQINDIICKLNYLKFSPQNLTNISNGIATHLDPFISVSVNQTNQNGSGNLGISNSQINHILTALDLVHTFNNQWDQVNIEKILNSPRANFNVAQHKTSYDNFLINYPTNEDKEHAELFMTNVFTDQEFADLSTSSFSWSGIMWDIAKELAGDKAVDIMAQFIPGFSNVDELKDAVKAAKNGDWLEFTAEIAKIVGQNTPWGKILQVAEAGSELYNFCKKIDNIWDKINTYSTAVASKMWDIIKKCPESIRTNPTIISDLIKAVNRGAKSISDVVNHANVPWINSNSVTHIFRGDSFNGGRHHISALISDPTIKITHIKKRNSAGFYEVSLQKSGNPPLTMEDKSFFPDIWDENRVVDAIKAAFNNKVQVPNKPKEHIMDN
jgi:hypothetical protein